MKFGDHGNDWNWAAYPRALFTYSISLLFPRLFLKSRSSWHRCYEQMQTE